MIAPPSGVRVWLVTGATDMRRGMNGLALQVQEALHRDPHAGDLYVFRGRRGTAVLDAEVALLPFRRFTTLAVVRTVLDVLGSMRKLASPHNATIQEFARRGRGRGLVGGKVKTLQAGEAAPIAHASPLRGRRHLIEPFGAPKRLFHG
jgi:hypothetical protein